MVRIRNCFLLAAAALVLTLSGCGGGNGATDAVESLVEAQSSSDYDTAWQMLHPAQQQIITQTRYAECGRTLEQNRSPVVDEVKVIDTSSGEVDIAGAGASKVENVTVDLVRGENTRRTTYSVVKVDGKWRWFVDQEVLDTFAAGECPF